MISNIFFYRGQLQIALQLENYIAVNTPKGLTSTSAAASMVRVDDDFVWELANLVRWLSQVFKQRFKIEKFLFGEIYAAYHGGVATELVQSLMEELGYDKDDDDDSDAESESPNKSANNSDLLAQSAQSTQQVQQPITSPSGNLLLSSGNQIIPTNNPKLFSFQFVFSKFKLKQVYNLVNV